MDGQSNSANCKKKPLQGYKKLMRSQVQRLRHKATQQVKLNSSSTSDERLGRNFERYPSPTVPDIPDGLKQESREKPQETQTVLNCDEKKMSNLSDPSVGHYNKATEGLVEKQKQLQGVSGVHVSVDSEDLGSNVTGRQAPYAERKRVEEPPRERDLPLAAWSQQREEMQRCIANQTSPNTAAYHFSWGTSEGRKVHFSKQLKFQQEDRDVDHPPASQVKAGDEWSQAIGKPREMQQVQRRGTLNDMNNDVSVEIEDPITTGLLLAEQGEFFHNTKAKTPQLSCSRQEKKEEHRDTDQAMISTSQQVKVAVCKQSVAEISTNTMIAVRGNLQPASITCPPVHASFSVSPNINRNRPLKRVQFADEVCRALRSDSAAVPTKAATNSSLSRIGQMVPRGRDQTSYELVRKGSLHEEAQERKAKERPLSRLTPRLTEVTVPSMDTGRKHDPPKKVEHAKRDETVQRTSDVWVEMNSKERYEDKQTQPTSTFSLLLKEKPSPASGFVDFDEKQSQDVTSPSSEVAENRVTTRGSSFCTSRQLLVKSRSLSHVDLVKPSYCREDNIERNRKSLPSITTQTSMLSVQSDSATSSTQIEQRTGRERVQSKRTRSRFICRLIRVCVVVFVLLATAQVLALCLALGFATECDKYNILFSPFWGFPWVQVDMSPVAMFLRQNLRLIHFKPTPT